MNNKISNQINIPGNDNVTYFITSGSETAVEITYYANNGYAFTKNYTTYYECAVKHDAIVEWYKIQKTIYESAK